MTTSRSGDRSKVSGDAIRRVERARMRAHRRRVRYRLAVLGSNTAEVVEHAGGLVFDRMMAGWDVTVLVAGDPNHRAMQILGSDAIDLKLALEYGGNIPWPHAVAVSGRLYDSEPRIRDSLLQSIEQRTGEVMLWGNTCETIGRRVASIEHRLSAAARVFKAQAVWAATGIPAAGVCAGELFQCNEQPRYPRLGHDFSSAWSAPLGQIPT